MLTDSRSTRSARLLTTGFLVAYTFAISLMPSSCASSPSGPTSTTQDSSSDLDILRATHLELGEGARGEAVRAVNTYLTQFGYFPNADLEQRYPSWRPLVSKGPADPMFFDPQTAAGVLAFQAHAGLPKTGVLDEATKTMMITPRCGDPDGIPLPDPSDKYDIGGRQSPSSITWNFSGTPPTGTGLTTSQVQTAAANATTTWAQQMNLGISQSASNPTVPITFGPITLNGVLQKNVLAVTNSSGILLSDGSNGVQWSVSAAPNKSDLQTVLLHEFGHSLGLLHSDFGNGSSGAIMFPTITTGVQHWTLDIDDKVAISVNYDQWGPALPNGANDIASGPDGSLWIIGQDQRIYKWTLPTWTVDASAGKGTAITVDPSGKPWIVGTTGQPYHYSSNNPATGTWQAGPTGCARDIGAGADGSVWVIGCDGTLDSSIFKLVGSQWTAVSVGGSASRIAVGPTGVPWVSNFSGTISRLSTSDPTTGRWSGLPGTAHDIGISQTNANNNNYAWIIGTTSVGSSNGDFDVEAFDEQPAGPTDGGQGTQPAVAEQKWLAFNGGGGGVKITVDLKGEPFIVNDAGKIFTPVR